MSVRAVDGFRTRGPVVRAGGSAPFTASSGRTVVHVIGCLSGIGLLQFAVRVLLPRSLDAGPAFAVAMFGNLLLAAAVASIVCSVLRRLLPAVMRDAFAALASIAVLYLGVLASFLGLDIIQNATPVGDALLATAVGGLLAVALVAVRTRHGSGAERGRKHRGAPGDQGVRAAAGVARAGGEGRGRGRISSPR